MGGLIFLGVVAVAALFVISKSFKIVGQAEVMVVERLGRFHRVARSGLNILLPFIEVPRTTCRSLEFYRAAEVIEVGQELAAIALDTFVDHPAAVADESAAEASDL